MRTPHLHNQNGRVIARLSDGRIVREAQIHDPAESLEEGWEATGRYLREAIDSSKSQTMN
ncbi:hypothetical protein [Corynebacterium propinquum]|uniref:hypothetical protein n=1 Tax=Corynebacterium propinquum TaxID=43769 RepID=UPI003B642AF6